MATLKTSGFPGSSELQKANVDRDVADAIKAYDSLLIEVTNTSDSKKIIKQLEKEFRSELSATQAPELSPDESLSDIATFSDAEYSQDIAKAIRKESEPEKDKDKNKGPDKDPNQPQHPNQPPADPASAALAGLFAGLRSPFQPRDNSTIKDMANRKPVTQRIIQNNNVMRQGVNELARANMLAQIMSRKAESHFSQVDYDWESGLNDLKAGKKSPASQKLTKDKAGMRILTQKDAAFRNLIEAIDPKKMSQLTKLAGSKEVSSRFSSLLIAEQSKSLDMLKLTEPSLMTGKFQKLADNIKEFLNKFASAFSLRNSDGGQLEEQRGR